MNNDCIISINPVSKLLSSTIQSKVGNQKLSTATSVSKTTTSNTKMIGNYILGKLLGKGTFGSVHLALHIPTNQKVAVKIIDKSNMTRKKDITRMNRQIQIMKKIHHRHIVQLYQIIQTKNSLLLFQQHLPNGQLFKEILKKKRFSQIQACKYFQQIISALQYLHNNKITHRDLKPQNILIDCDGQIKLIDFGLSSQYQKDMNTFCGSPCYAAPQIVEGKKSYNPQLSDIWSCGIILFTMLAGYLPFCQTNVNIMFKKILTCNYQMPDFLSASAKNLIQNLLALTPSKRISIQQIQNHEWFNQIPFKQAYGVNKDQYLPYSQEIICNLQKFGIDTSYFKDYDKQIIKKNKQTASYYILMKKLIKNEQFIPYYIGNDYFDYNLIKKKDNKQIEEQNETQPINITNDPYNKDNNKQNQLIQPGTDTQYDTYTQNEIKLSQRKEINLNFGYPQQNLKVINQKQLFNMVKNVYDLALKPFFKLQNFNKNNNLRQKGLYLLQNQFYKDNLNNKKVFLKRIYKIQNLTNKTNQQNKIIEQTYRYKSVKISKRIKNNSMMKSQQNKVNYNKNNIQQNNKFSPYLGTNNFRIKKQINKNQLIVLYKQRQKEWLS